MDKEKENKSTLEQKPEIRSIGNGRPSRDAANPPEKISK